jgi:hypothetical protein
MPRVATILGWAAGDRPSVVSRYRAASFCSYSRAISNKAGVDWQAAGEVMLGLKFSARLSRAPNRHDYLLALVFVLASLIARAAIEALSPGIAYYVVMLPAVVFAGVFCGTGPAVLAAFAGGAAVAGFMVGHGLLNHSFTTTNLDTLVYIPACGAVIWSTAQLRRFAAEATQTRARLQETLDARDTLVREADHREPPKSESEHNNHVIRRTRESIAETERHVADSVDRLIESQKRLRGAHTDTASARRPH